MPELPEVETVRKGLLQLVQGKTIQSVDVRWPRIIESPEVELFTESLIGQTIKTIERRGKFLIFKLTNFDLISHLRMEGKYEFFAAEETAIIDKHSHVIFTFTDQSCLIYHDVRKFGRMTLVPANQSASYKGIQQLGPEPRPEVFLFEPFQEKLQRSKKALKPLLLDQKLVTGLGNIYVDEALWEAQIHPELAAHLLTEAEAIRLHQAIIDVLERAVAAGGTTIRSYVNALGEAGKFQVSLHAYGQTDRPCSRCQTPIVKIKVAQRGTHFFPHCQPWRGK